MMCFWTAAIGYLLEEIQIDLNVRFRTSTMRLELGNLSLNIRKRVNKINGCDHIEQYQLTVPKYRGEWTR